MKLYEKSINVLRRNSINVLRRIDKNFRKIPLKFQENLIKILQKLFY